MQRKRTWKRQVAAACLLALFGLAVHAGMAETAELVEARAKMVADLAMPVFLFAAAAFGLDWADKQAGLTFGMVGRPPSTPPVAPADWQAPGNYVDGGAP